MSTLVEKPTCDHCFYVVDPPFPKDVEVVKAKLTALLEAHASLRADYTKVRNECDSLRADAERYRKIPSLCGVYFALGTTKEQLDAAIDTAGKAK